MVDRPVFYFTRVLTAYRIPILERLNGALGNRLVVCYGQPPRATSTLIGKREGNFVHEVARNYWFRGETLHLQPYTHVFEKHGAPAVVIAEESPRSISLPFLLHHARRNGAGRVLWGIFYSVFRPFSATHPLQRYRLHLAKRVEACACYTRGVREILIPHVDPAKLFVAQNTLDTDTLFAQRRALEVEGKKRVRQRLNIPADHAVIAFTGQLVPRKGTDLLLSVFADLRKERPASLLVIGDGPERGSMEERVRAERIPDVRFLGSISRLEASAPYLYAADLMLLPGYVGLVANHAFAMGLPIVTQEAPGNTPFHGPEVESVISGTNGFITERDGDAVLAAVQEVLQAPDRFSRAAARYAEQHLSAEIMVDGLLGAISHAAERAQTS